MRVLADIAARPNRAYATHMPTSAGFAPGPYTEGPPHRPPGHPPTDLGMHLVWCPACERYVPPGHSCPIGKPVDRRMLKRSFTPKEFWDERTKPLPWKSAPDPDWMREVQAFTAKWDWGDDILGVPVAGRSAHGRARLVHCSERDRGCGTAWGGFVVGLMSWLQSLWDAFVSLFVTSPKFVDTDTNGVPNLVQFHPGMWRMGQPVNADAWRALQRVVAPSNQRVVVVKLNDDAEGDDSPARLVGWLVLKNPIPPEDDKPWSVLLKPKPEDVQGVVKTILTAKEEGVTVVWHCTHGRDRTGLISAIVGMRLLGWTKKEAWQNMLDHGFRWELPNLDAYWAENVR